MSDNTLKKQLAAGGHAINGWLTIASPFSTELMMQAGFDSLTLDMQHGLHDYSSVVSCLQTMQGAPMTPLVRVPSNDFSLIGKVLDAGAQGVIGPMLHNVDDYQKFISACRYPPQGERSNGPIRAGLYQEPGAYQKTANDRILCIPMIETRGAIAHFDDIVRLDGIDGFYIGPSDLSWSLGLAPALDRQEPEILDIYTRIIKGAAGRGIKTFIHCGSADYASQAIKMGFDVVTVSNDSALLLNGAQNIVAKTHELIARRHSA